MKNLPDVHHWLWKVSLIDDILKICLKRLLWRCLLAYSFVTIFDFIIKLFGIRIISLKYSYPGRYQCDLFWCKRTRKRPWICLHSYKSISAGYTGNPGWNLHTRESRSFCFHLNYLFIKGDLIAYSLILLSK